MLEVSASPDAPSATFSAMRHLARHSPPSSARSARASSAPTAPAKKATPRRPTAPAKKAAPRRPTAPKPTAPIDLPHILRDPALETVNFGSIQIPFCVLADVANEIAAVGKARPPRVLVFGLGHDTPVYRHFVGRAGGKLIFVEESEQWMPKDGTLALHVPAQRWSTRVDGGLVETEALLPVERQALEELLGEGPLEFDLVIVDAPTGYAAGCPGRQGACWWASQLVRPGGIVYVDDAERALEAASVARYLAAPGFERAGQWDTCGKITLKMKRSPASA
jgi:hypothetical protein